MNNATQRTFNAEEALAQGAITAGVRLVTSYPGSPGIGVMNTLIAHAKKTDEVYVEWSVNERVALEMGIGASMAGRRSLVCVKSVGMNVLLDPLMTLNLIEIHGGLVILLGDDPGGYGSQNEQDTRLLAHLMEIPMLEPSSTSEGYAMMCDAFVLSERFKIPIILRITRSFTQQADTFLPELKSAELQTGNLGLVREPYRYVPYPGNAVEMHRQLHQRLDHFAGWTDTTNWDQIIGLGTYGVLAAGFCYQKLMDVIGESVPGNLRILKISTLYPLPTEMIKRFLADCDHILVLEESDAFVENGVCALAHRVELKTRVLGKLSGHLPMGGELFRWQIQAVLEDFLPSFRPSRVYSPANEAAEVPAKNNHCASSPNEEILEIIKEAAAELRQKPILIADPGCWVKVAGELDGKFAIGSSVAVASGLIKAGVDEPVVALFGDSAFFHSAIPAICNAAYNESNVFIILLDNHGALSTGRQPTPAMGVDFNRKSSTQPECSSNREILWCYTYPSIVIQ